MFNLRASSRLWQAAALVLTPFISVQVLAATAAPVAVITPKYEAVFREVKITGTVTSPRVAQLSTAISGQVEKLSVDEGDLVSAGSSLLELDDELAEFDWERVNALLQQEQAVVADARRRLKEAEALAPKGSIAVTQIEDIRAEVVQEEAALAQAKADAGYQRALLERHRLKAPFDGMISQRLVELGEWVTPGQGAFELVAMDGLRLDFELAEDYLGQVSKESEVSFTINALSDRRFNGQVQAVVPVTNPGARTFLVRVIPESPVAELMPGMSVNAVVRIATNQQALVVPRDAILRNQNGRIVVWVVTGEDEQAIANERQVTVDLAFDGYVVVLSGIEAGERVVVQGNESLQNGQSVNIVSSYKGD